MPTSSLSSVEADDRELVARFLRGRDESAFRALYRAHAPALYAFALRLTRGNEAEAQDLLQEMWLRATPKLASFRWQSSLRTWLHAIAINVHRERVRRAVRERQRAEDERARFSLVTEAKGPGADLERGIRELPDGYREVLLLHDLEGYTHKEIGSMLGIEEGTSKSQLSKARAAMRTWMQRQGARRDAR